MTAHRTTRTPRTRTNVQCAQARHLLRAVAAAVLAAALVGCVQVQTLDARPSPGRCVVASPDTAASDASARADNATAPGTPGALPSPTQATPPPPMPPPRRR